MKRLPLGHQDFADLIERDCIYVDKTQHIYQLIQHKYFFLSRPRRFGKSLLISTLKELLSGNKELFRGLWIFDKITWEQYPIIHIDFSELDYFHQSLGEALERKIKSIANDHQINLTENTFKDNFILLIKRLSKERKVVILIDEYDKPIIDFLDEINIAEKNRQILKYFYSAIKPCDRYLHFFFATGVSKFSKVSVFSDLNHLTDITLHKDFSTIAGITPEEFRTHFTEHIEILEKEYQDVYDNIFEAIKDEYLGYSWDAENLVFNPFSVLQLLNQKRFGDFWFKTGTPTFLVKKIREMEYTAMEISNKEVTENNFDKFSIENLELIPLLFQTGYLTIKRYDKQRKRFLLDYPNKEVERAFTINILSEFNGKKTDKTDSLLSEITQSIEENDIERFIFKLKILFKGIAYPVIEDKENYYHSIFYLVLKMLGFYINAEILTCDGRIDAVLITRDYIYITEFKLSDAKTALSQIKSKEYHLKYADTKKQIVLLAIGFDTMQKNIGDFLTERFPET